MNRGTRFARSIAARQRRKALKVIRETRLENLFSKARRARKRKQKLSHS